jgi:hypothetical protein
MHERYYIVSGAAMIGLLITTVALLVRACRFDPREASGLLAILAGWIILALGIGWGRAGVSDREGLSFRYTTLGLPLLCCVYFAWKKYAPRFHVLFLPLGLSIYLVTIPVALQKGQEIDDALDQVAREARAGNSAGDLSRRYADRLFFSRTTALERAFRGLRDLRVGAFQYIDKDK